MAFLSSLFFSLMFIKLTRYADARPGGHCDIPVNLVLDEFNNIGRIGGAADGSDFARSLSVIRSRDIRVMMAVQSLGQLQNRYGNVMEGENRKRSSLCVKESLEIGCRFYNEIFDALGNRRGNYHAADCRGGWTALERC